MKHLKIYLAVWGLLLAHVALAQRNSVYQQYIDAYHEEAIEQMRRHRIPASITLAQALLESGAGKSYLATKANNHFGIKVGMGWNGPYVVRDDDRQGERFRKYKSVRESYEDHSLFLKRPRYQRLFDLDPLDYKAWARGLKACGYATLPTYAARLIQIIETYELDAYDEDCVGVRKRKKDVAPVVAQTAEHVVGLVNSKRCVTARSGDTWDALAKELKISKRKLLKYNEARADIMPLVGMNVFLEKKATRADRQYKHKWHKVKYGESLYSISQFYGIRLERLYKMNYKDDSYTPVVGDLLKVR